MPSVSTRSPADETATTPIAVARFHRTNTAQPPQRYPARCSRGVDCAAPMAIDSSIMSCETSARHHRGPSSAGASAVPYASRRSEMTTAAAIAAAAAPPSSRTLTAANCAEPVKTRIENPIASPTPSPAWAQATPKATPNGETATLMDSACLRIAERADRSSLIRPDCGRGTSAATRRGFVRSCRRRPAGCARPPRGAGPTGA